ncbi:MAG TPA: hypothetical protein VM889_02445, partial [Candidatus Thermoplasmatota archaeon]|nr:hypothetical protein [Candidatus Thermoplasmatota archaeon]
VFEILSVEPVEAPAPAVVRVPVQGRERAMPPPAPEPVADETAVEAPPAPEPVAEPAPEAPVAAMEAAVDTAAEPARANVVRDLFGKLKLPRRRTDDAMPPPASEAEDEAPKAAPFGLGKLRFPRRAAESADAAPAEAAETKPAKSLAERLPKLPSIKLPKRVAKPPPRDPDLKEVIPPAPRATLAERLKRRLAKDETPVPAAPAPEAPVEAPPAPEPEPVAAAPEPAAPRPRAPFAPTPELLATVGERADAVIARAVERRVEVTLPEAVEARVEAAAAGEAEAATSVPVERVEPVPEPSFAPLEPAPWEDRLEAVLAARGSTKR